VNKFDDLRWDVIIAEDGLTNSLLDDKPEKTVAYWRRRLVDARAALAALKA
jgi:hypothetical protein